MLELSLLPQGVLVAIVFIFGLMVGSFLNVVIYRLPKMMERAWKKEALAFLHATDPSSLSESARQTAAQLSTTDSPAFNLAYPPSRCGSCGHGLSWYDNIPVISWCVLRAKCRSCGSSIASRYPLVELLTGLTSAWIAYRYGWSVQTAACLVLNAMLMCAFWIDWDTQLLPDDLTLPLIWGGLILAYSGYGLVSFQEAFWGAIAGYGLLWSVYWLFYLIFKKEGMGFGDFKLLAALGAWLGWPALPMIVLMASLGGLLYALVRALTGMSSPSENTSTTAAESATGAAAEQDEGHRWSRPLPFGPFLITGGWMVWMVVPADLFLSLTAL